MKDIPPNNVHFYQECIGEEKGARIDRAGPVAARLATGLSAYADAHVFHHRMKGTAGPYLSCSCSEAQSGSGWWVIGQVHGGATISDMAFRLSLI